MKLVYVSGPITGDGSPNTRWENCNEGRRVCREIRCLLPDDLSVVNPFGDSLFMDGPNLPYEHFLQSDLELLGRLDGIVMLPRWRESKGATREREHALRLGLPVFYWPLDRPALMRWAAGEPYQHLDKAAFWPTAHGQGRPLTEGGMSDTTDRELLEARIDLTIARFNFKRARQVMNCLQWKWANERCEGVPSEEDLEDMARYLLRHSVRSEGGTVESGGLSATFYSGGHSGEGFFRLRFVAAESDSESYTTLPEKK